MSLYPIKILFVGLIIRHSGDDSHMGVDGKGRKSPKSLYKINV